MKTRMKKFGILAAIVIAVFIWWRHEFPSATWRYKITVEIETPEGIKTGSAVRQVTARMQPQFPGPEVPPVVYDVIGEAVMVDLGKRGVLFALIDWDSFHEVYDAFPSPTQNYAERLEYYKSLAFGTRAELKKDLPKMVTFKDMKDPRTIEVVYDVSFSRKTALNRFEEIFGKNVHLGQVTVEMTDDPVTNEVLQTLPELNGRKPYAIGPYQFKKGE